MRNTQAHLIAYKQKGNGKWQRDRAGKEGGEV